MAYARARAAEVRTPPPLVVFPGQAEVRDRAGHLDARDDHHDYRDHEEAEKIIESVLPNA